MNGARMITAVFMAHDRCIRFSVQSGRWCLWKRRRGGLMHERHPSLENALKEYRTYWKLRQEWPKGYLEGKSENNN